MDDSRFSRARSCVQWRVIACAFFSLLVGTAANLVRPSYQGLILDSVIAGAKHAFWSHVYTKRHHFIKTGSGQT
jgi:hypothetical protein